MDIYGLNPTGKLYIEKVQKKSTWSSLSIGQLILELETGNSYLGSIDGMHGDDGWILIGLSNSVVRNSNIDWNYEMDENLDKISSLNIPCNYNNIITNVQSAITDLECNINNLIYNPSEFIPPGIINSLHLDTTSILAITAKTIPIIDYYDRFISTNVEDALLERLTSAEMIIMPPDTEFGKLLKMDVNHVENALINLEQYLYTLPAESISVNYDTTTITIQEAFDDVLQYYIPCFSNFKDTCCEDNQILISKDNKFECSDLNLNIQILACSGEKKDIQTAYNEICIELNTLENLNTETNRMLENILKEIGTIYCVLQKCLTCNIWELEC